VFEKGGASSSSSCEKAPAPPPPFQPGPSMTKLAETDPARAAELVMMMKEKVKGTQKKVKMKVAKELLDTETNYFKCLSQLSTKFADPWGSIDRSKSTTQSDTFLASLEKIRKFHEILQKNLATRLNEEWENKAIISDLFAAVAEKLSIYKDYIMHYHWMILHIRYHKTRENKLNQVVKLFNATQTITPGLMLDDFLIMPVQRIPRYLLLLKDFMKYSKDDLEEINALEGVVGEMDVKLKEINSQVDQKQQSLISDLLMVNQSVVGFGPFLDKLRPLYLRGDVRLVDIHMRLHKRHQPNTVFGGSKREQLRKSIIYKQISGKKKMQNMHWYLFSDVLIICEPTPGGGEKPHTLSLSLPLSCFKGAKKVPKRDTWIKLSFFDDNHHDEKVDAEEWFIEPVINQYLVWLTHLSQAKAGGATSKK